MSAINFARQAFSREKPHSSITDWVDILTASTYEEEAYDGIPELVDSINLQAAGPAEASRALRKKLKHGEPHRQYRALVILKALVENCGHKFQTTFADGQLTDALKHLASDPGTDQKVKKKLLAVLASWHNQFKSDPSMALVAALYSQCRPDRHISQAFEGMGLSTPDPEYERKKQEKEDAKKKAKRDKEEARERERRRLEEVKRQNQPKVKRLPFDFEKEKPKVLSSIVDASQASSNLVNAITLVNQDKDSLQTNERVQECLGKAKQARKQIVRYIQLVENEELIGTLIETNERIIAAMEMYDKLSTQHPTSDADLSNAVTAGLSAARMTMTDSEVNKLQEKQRAAVERARRGNESVRGKEKASNGDERNGGYVHPDLQDLNFGALGASSSNLPPPIRPSALSDDGDAADDNEAWKRGSLSDFSDYESSDEETHNRATSGSTSRRDYVSVSDSEEESVLPVHGGKSVVNNKAALVEVEDPFADPFADEVAVGPQRW